MAEVYRLYTEADYDATTKVTGVGQAQAWDNASRLANVSGGDLKITLNDSGINTVYAQKNGLSLADTVYLNSRFYVDPSDLVFEVGDGVLLYWPRDIAGNHTPFLLYLENVGGELKLRVISYSDGQSSSVTAYADITQEEHYIEALLKRASTDVATDTELTVSIDGVVVYTRTSYNYYDSFALLNTVRFGVSTILGSAVPGDLYLGKLLITNDANPIGPIRSYRHRPRPAAIMKKRQRIKGYRCG